MVSYRPCNCQEIFGVFGIERFGRSHHRGVGPDRDKKIKAAVEVLCSIHVRVVAESGGTVTTLFQKLGQGGEAVQQPGVLDMCPAFIRQESTEQGRVGWKGPARGGYGLGKPESLCSKSIDVGCRWTMVSIAGEMVGASSIHDNDQNVWIRVIQARSI